MSLTCGWECLLPVSGNVFYLWVGMSFTCEWKCLLPVGENVFYLWVEMSFTCGWECLSPVGENVSHPWVGMSLTRRWECLPLVGRNVFSLKIEIHETITNPDNILLCSVDSYVCLKSNACLDWKWIYSNIRYNYNSLIILSSWISISSFLFILMAWSPFCEPLTVEVNGGWDDTPPHDWYRIHAFVLPIKN